MDGLTNTLAAEQMRWLMGSIGLEGNPVKQYDVEYISEGGGYSMSKMSASSISELVEGLVERNSHSKSIGRMCVSPIVLNEIRQLTLMNSGVRI